jgi:hypothetical protein
MYAKMFAGWPGPVCGQLIEAHLSTEWWQAGVRERSNMPQLAGELKQGGHLPDVPVIVLTTLGVEAACGCSPLGSLRAMADGKRRLYAALAGSVSRGEHRVSGDARHSAVTIDCLDAVIQAIRDLLVRASHQPGGPPAIALGLTTTRTG